MQFLLLLWLLAASTLNSRGDDLGLRRNGSTLTLEASTDFQHWQAITNLAHDEPQKFFRSAATNPVALNFLYEPRQLRAVDFALTYYYSDKATPLVDTYPYQDAQQIRQFKALDGKLYDHITLLTEYAMALYDAYLKTSDIAYLDRMEAYAQRALTMRVESRGAWFYQNNFPVSLKYPEVIDPPGWGSIGQGNALSMFIRLYELTNKPEYLEAIQKTFASYKLPAVSGLPFITELDSDGYLWFEEYATAENRPEYVYNGHIFGMFGLYDYYIFSHDPDAARLLEGGLLTAKHYFQWFRTPNWVIKYSRRTPVQNPSYQAPVTRQLRILYSMTADTYFATAAEQLADDYPTPQGCPCTLYGGVNAYQFDAAGAITNRMSYVFTNREIHWGDVRRRILNQPGLWIKPLNGPVTNYFIREFPDQAAMNCIIQPITFDPPRKLTLLKDQAKFTFSKYGGVYATLLDRVTRSYTADQTMQFDQRASVNGEIAIRIANGDLGGYWLPLSISTLLD